MTSSSYINENYLDYSEFQPINEINNEKISVVRKAKWIKHDIKVALKGLIPNEFIQEIRQFCKVRCHLNPNINKILGTTKGPFDNDIVVLEYANEGNLREYLYDQFMTLNWRKKMEMALDITRGLMCLHSENIIHRNLHSRNILVNDDKLKIADFAYSTQLFEDMPMSKVPMIEYTDPKYLFDPLNCKLDFKSDIYSLSILLWELSSGYPAYSKFQQSDQLRYDIINGLREETVGNTPVKYQWLYQKCWEQDPDQRLNISEVLEILDQLTEVNIDDPVVQNDDQEIIQNLKLNYGLFLYGYGMQHSKYAIYDDIGELEISLYDGQPLVYTNINDKPYDACINFPFAEITYKGNLLDTFLNYDDMDGKLNNFYGHFYSDKVLVGGQLFIKDFNTTQIQFLKMHISWAYNLVKSEENRSYNFINLQIEPRVETWDGKEIKTTEKLINWMNKIYQENVIDVIAYINPLRVSDLKGSKANVQPTSDSRDFNEIIIKVSNYKDRLNLDEWVKDSMYVNLPDDFNLFNLFQGLIIDKNLEMEIAKEVVIDLIKYPCLESKDNYNLKFEKPTNKLEEFLTSNNIFSIKKKINSPIFNNQFIMNNDELNYHFIINYEQYEILLPWNHLLLSKKFEEKLENAIKMMSPLKNLLNLFDEYGHLFPQKVILGKSFKYITTKNNPKFEGYPKMSTIESLKLYLKNLEIPYLSTQKGEIKIEDLSDFIQENEYLEIIEYDNVITLYDMLQRKQQYQVDHIFDYKIIMVGLYSLEDLNDDNTDIEHYVRISINTPLEDQDYEVFGSIISNKPTLRKPAIKFRSCDFKGFTAIINNLETQNLDFKITECYVLWMIVGKPSKLSIFSFDNQDFQVIRISESILLQPDKSYYEIKTPFRLSQGCMISINTYHPPINNEPTNLIEFVKWSYNSIIFHSNSILEALNINENEVGIEDEDNLLIENLSIELHICILFSNSKKLKVDNEVNEYSLDIIGNILTKENFIYSLNTEIDIMAVNNANDADKNHLNFIVKNIIDFLFNEKRFTFDEDKKVKVIFENYITNRNINLLNWLSNNQNNPNNIFLLGYFYCFIIKTSEVYKKVFNLFYNAINDKYEFANNLAKYYIGICYLNGIGIEKNNIKAFKYFEQLSEYYTDGMVMLGYCYINGIGTEINKKMAFKFYEKAANKENAYAQNKLSLFYKSGIEIKKDLDEAIYWIKKSAKNNNFDGKNILNTLYIYCKNIQIDENDLFLQAKNKIKEENNKEAYYDLGNYYEYGIGIRINIKNAFNNYFLAAEKGHPKANFKVGNFYYNGKEIEVNKKEAFKYYIKAVKEKYKIAQNNLGILYENGEGIEKDLKKAIDLYEKSECKDGYYNLGLYYEFKKNNEINAFNFYKKAAEYKHLDALFRLGNFYLKGIGIKINYKEAFKLYKEAAKKGHEVAQNKLGSLYENRNKKKIDLVKAFFWYKKSADNKYNLAYFNIGRCYENKIGIKSNNSKAFIFYKKAAKEKHLDAMFKVAEYYSKGIGIEINNMKAFKWYQKAAKNKYKNAMYNLAICYQNGKGTEINLKEAFNWYKKAAEKEHIEAQNNIGYLYKKGEGTEKNLEKAFYWYEKAAKNEHIEAQNNVGYLYEKGEGIEKNLEKAFYWYQKAAKNEHIEAQNNVGCLYEIGEGIEKNLEKAFYWYQKAAKNGHIEAQNNVGYLYKKGEGIEKNSEKAFYWYQKAAKDEHIEAQNNIGYLYEKGEGTEKNLEKAFYWYQKAAKNGHIEAQNNVGCLYEKGEGIEKNLEKAFYWYKKAAENNNEASIFHLANYYYYHKLRTQKDLEKAFYWYQKAVEKDCIKAINSLAICYNNGEGTEKNLEKAFYWFQKAAENNDEYAMFNLAICYYNGEGTEKNLEKAFCWYKKAAENGNKSAINNLANCYYNGKGIEKNLKEAIYWYKKAAENDNKQAMLNLFNIYKNSEGIEKNLEKAFYWRKKIVENNNNKFKPCNECKELINTDYEWCRQCNSKYYFQQDFSKWTSNNKYIDEFIQSAQLNAKNCYEVLEWIPYNKLSIINNYYDKGRFSEIHKAIWLDGPIENWNFDK